MNIDQIKNPSKLDIVTFRPDIRRDLHVFTDYVRDREVKRAHRDNSLSKADSKRLAKLLSDPEAEAEVADEGYSIWIHFVDRFARRLGLVHYDTEGVYAGYTSREPCYPDNFIQFDERAYEKLSSMKLADQERHLLELLLKDNQGSSSEFYRSCFSGRLGGFAPWGSATGVMPTLDFTAIRRFLLELLSGCPVGQWLSVAALVEYLKQHHRYFLIPRKPQFNKEWDKKKGRYGNFYESKDEWGHEIEIKETDSDSFERVEGRYVERFLESIPHLLGYVDVAYAKRRPKGVYPSLGYLQAFRVNERLRRALDGKIAEPTLKVTPSFDLYVQSEVYPARLIRALAPVSDLVSEDTTMVFRLVRQKVAQACAGDSKLDVTRLLESLSTEPLPANVRRELSEWTAHSDKFILYCGCSLLETNGQVPDVERFRVEKIAKGIDVVRSPAKLYAELEKQELAPLRIKHGENSFAPLPAKTRSAFPRKSADKKRRERKTKITLMRVTQVQLLCPDRDFLQRLQGLLADVNCPVEADRKRLLLAYSSRHEKEVSRAIRALKKEFEVKIDDQ